MANILIIDDDEDFRTALAATLRSLGHSVRIAVDGSDGLAQMEHGEPNLVFVDYRMPGMDGLALLRSRHADGAAQTIPIIMLTAFASGQNTIEAMRYGAFDHLTKPVGRDELAAAIARALPAEESARGVGVPVAVDGEMLGNSQAMRQVQKRIGLAAASDVPVLVTGETGTGKEMVAQALHRASARAAGPFLAVNCAAIPPDLLESELFGHQKGAFSGASVERKGYFREANGGTLLLDEIGDMPPAMQAKLLRVLQEGEVTPLGTSRALPIDVRVVAATHRDLAERVAAGAFRSDLYYRLNVLPIELTPLRDRLDDIEALAQHFLRNGVARPKQLSNEALARLRAYDWPGNIRELRNIMERCRVLVQGPTVNASDLDGLFQSRAPAPVHAEGESLPMALARVERTMIEKALAETGGNRAEAARRLGIHRQLLYRKLDEHGLG